MNERDALILAGALAGVVATGAVGGAEAAMSAFSQHRLDQLVEEGRLHLRALQDRSRVLTAVMMSRALLLLLVGGLTTTWAFQVRPEPWFVALSLLGTAVLVMLAEILGRLLSLRNTERAFLRAAPLLRFLSVLLSPVLAVLVLISGPMAGATGRGLLAAPLVTEEDVKHLIEQGKAQGVLEREEAEMIHSIIEFGDTIAREVMVPRVDILAVSLGTPLTEVVDLMIERGFSRLPVYQDSIDHVVGLVYSKDLLVVERQGTLDTPLADLLRPAKFVPGSKTVDGILRELQQEKVAMAIVVDEYGGTEGLLTMEDILEEIVGEITDEYDPDLAPVVELQDGSALVDAKMILEDVNDKLGVNIPVDEHETLGGYVYGIVGRVPIQGESVEVDGVRLTVVGVNRQRRTSVRVQRLEAREQAEARETA